MNTPNPQELRDASGNIVGYFLPAQDYAQLKTENETLRRQVKSLLPIATDQEELEMAAQLHDAVPLDLTELIQELESPRSRP